MELTERQHRILDIGLSYLYSNLDDMNDIINSDNEVVDQCFGIRLDGSISEEEVQALREVIRPELFKGKDKSPEIKDET